MPIAYFQIPLTVQPTGGGAAELVPPEAVQALDYHFVVVKDGGTEGIIRVEAPAADLKKLEAETEFQKLTTAKVKSQQKDYPLPKVKQKYRRGLQAKGADAAAAPMDIEVDKQGNQIVENIQTVRSGFYLIDVPVIAEMIEDSTLKFTKRLSKPD